MTRAIVEIRFGPRACEKAVIAPNGTLRVGRDPRADLSVPSDPRMSLFHFELSWDGATCRFEDLGSHAGSTLNGEPKPPRATGVIAHGGYVRAGDTIFSVFREGWPPPRVRPGSPPSPSPEAAAAQARLRAVGDGLYGIIDASRERRILELLHGSVDPYRSLYDGTQGDALAEVAPYLVRFEPGSALLDRLVYEGWGARWGVYLEHPRPLVEVRRHFRRFLMVEDEETRERMYFRFYDPKTMRTFLRTTTPRQEAQLFGETACFFFEGEAGELLSARPGEAR